MIKITYLAVLEPSNDGGYGVWFPDLPGCISYGKNIVEAQEMAKEALGLHLYGMELDCDIIPKPSEDIDNENEDIKVVKVNVDDAQDLAIKYQVMSIPTTVVIKEGQEVNRVVGMVSKSDLLEMVK